METEEGSREGAGEAVVREVEDLEVGPPGGDGEVDAMEGGGEGVVAKAEEGKAREAGEVVDGAVEAEAFENEAGDTAAAAGDAAPGGARVGDGVPRGEGGRDGAAEGELEGKEGGEVGVGRGGDKEEELRENVEEVAAAAMRCHLLIWRGFQFS